MNELTKTKENNRSPQQGSALLLTILITTATSVIIGSLMNYATSEARIFKRHALRIEARNAAESLVEIVSGELIRRLENGATVTSSTLETNPIELSTAVKNEIFNSSNVDVGSLAFKLYFLDEDGQWMSIDKDDPRYAGDALGGKKVWARSLLVAGYAKAQHGNIHSDAYVSHELLLRDSPLLNYAIFYNMIAELYPAQNFIVNGDIHVNGNFYAGPRRTLEFNGSSTVAGDYYMQEAPHRTNQGNGTTYFNNIAAEDSGLIYDSNMDDWANIGKQRYDDYLLTQDHGVNQLTPVATQEFIADDPSTAANEYSNSSYAIIEPILPKTVNGHANPDYKGDSVRESKVAYKAGLLLRVEYNTGYDPHTDPANEQYVVKGYKYERTDEFSPPSENSDGSLRLVEVGLPDGLIGDANPSFDGLDNPSATHPESYSTSTTESGNTVVSGGSYDVRQGTALDTFTLNMAVLEQAVNNPTASDTEIGDYSIQNDWNGVVYFEFPTSRSINSDGSFASGSSGGRSDQIVKAVSLTSSSTESAPLDMALQIINAGSLPRKAETGTEGFTLATNGPLYTIGHFNADGSVDSTSNHSPDGGAGGYHDVPAALLADTYTPLSENWENGRAYSSVAQRLTNDRYATDTEVSAAIIAGTTPTRQNADGSWESGVGSAGIQNFMRKMESWRENGSVTTLAYRGSIVSMFHSEAHPKRLSSFYNSAPDRHWGYHDYFSEGTFPPGLPLARDYARMNYQMLTEAEYNAL